MLAAETTGKRRVDWTGMGADAAVSAAGKGRGADVL
jgi:hypothetical protein